MQIKVDFYFYKGIAAIAVIVAIVAIVVIVVMVVIVAIDFADFIGNLYLLFVRCYDLLYGATWRPHLLFSRRGRLRTRTGNAHSNSLF